MQPGASAGSAARPRFCHDRAVACEAGARPASALRRRSAGRDRRRRPPPRAPSAGQLDRLSSSPVRRPGASARRRGRPAAARAAPARPMALGASSAKRAGLEQDELEAARAELGRIERRRTDPAQAEAHPAPPQAGERGRRGAVAHRVVERQHQAASASLRIVAQLLLELADEGGIGQARRRRSPHTTSTSRPSARAARSISAQRSSRSRSISPSSPQRAAVVR